jgi:REP element-mobilizing transposase RayT
MDTVIKKRKGNKLPHWTCNGATYAITYRLGDSLPQKLIGQLQFEINDIKNRVRQAKRDYTLEELNRLEFLQVGFIEKYLDAGYGSCLLKIPEAAGIVKESLFYFNGVRYDLHAWCIMPNHLHLIVEPLFEWTLSQITHTWKSYTVHEINKTLNRKGELWDSESYDHIIRDEADYQHCLHYLLQNPEKANLKNWPWCSRIEEFT